MNLPAKEELTAEEAVEMLDLLKGFTVLGPWVETVVDDDFVYTRFCLNANGRIYAEPFGAGCIVRSSVLAISMPAMSIEYCDPRNSIDAILAKRFDVLAIGVERQVRK
jgi:hypothetical protein